MRDRCELIAGSAARRAQVELSDESGSNRPTQAPRRTTVDDIAPPASSNGI
jgi:hypothetical protein